MTCMVFPHPPSYFEQIEAKKAELVRDIDIRFIISLTLGQDALENEHRELEKQTNSKQ